MLEVYVCGLCGAYSPDAAAVEFHIRSCHRYENTITPIEKEALLKIEEYVKHSPEYQEHYVQEAS